MAKYRIGEVGTGEQFHIFEADEMYIVGNSVTFLKRYAAILGLCPAVVTVAGCNLAPGQYVELIPETA